MRSGASTRSPEPSLWSCPRCRAKLVARNLAHACGDYSIDQFLAGKSRAGRLLFERFASLIAKCGPYSVAPAKTRVAFMAQVRFASVNRVGNDSIDVHFVLPRALRSGRFRRVDALGRLYVHHLRLEKPRDCDKELGAWLRASYVEYGERTWLQGERARRISEQTTTTPKSATISRRHESWEWRGRLRARESPVTASLSVRPASAG